MTVRVGVVGLGYVGLPLAVALAGADVDVVGVDTDPRKVDDLAAGGSHIEDVPDEVLRTALPRITVTTEFERLAGTDAIIVCVPTPLTPNREPDLAALHAAARAIGGVLEQGQLVVLESTSFPGTTRDLVRPALEESGLVAGTDFHLAFSPERVDPGRQDFDLRTTPRVVGGLTLACGERAARLYERICDTIVRVSSPEVAELSKLHENIFRSVNIAMVNEMSLLCDRMGIDVWEVIDAAATKPYGFMRFDPGPGMGGHCLPVDPFYLSWRARQFDMSTEFIELAGKVNQEMPYHCVRRVERALNGLSKPVRGSRVALIGVSYKAGVGDIRESPALKMIDLLLDLGAEVVYHDAFVPRISGSDLRSRPLDEVLRGAACAVIVTAHPGVDHAAIAARVPAVVDLRGATRVSSQRPGRRS